MSKLWVCEPPMLSHNRISCDTWCVVYSAWLCVCVRAAKCVVGVEHLAAQWQSICMQTKCRLGHRFLRCNLRELLLASATATRKMMWMESWATQHKWTNENCVPNTTRHDDVDIRRDEDDDDDDAYRKSFHVYNTIFKWNIGCAMRCLLLSHVCTYVHLNIVRLNILKINQQLHNCCGTKHDFELGSRVEQSIAYECLFRRHKDVDRAAEYFSAKFFSHERGKICDESCGSVCVRAPCMQRIR